jgi:hypothetical protein
LGGLPRAGTHREESASIRSTRRAVRSMIAYAPRARHCDKAQFHWLSAIDRERILHRFATSSACDARHIVLASSPSLAARRDHFARRRATPPSDAEAPESKKLRFCAEKYCRS